MNVSFTIHNLMAVSPELCVLGAAFLALLVDMSFRRKGRALAWGIGLLGIALALAALALTWGRPEKAFGVMLEADSLAFFTRLAVLLIGLLCLMVSRPIAPELGLDRAEYTSLILFATFGMMLLGGAAHLLTVFLALETFSLAMYILAGFNHRVPGNREAALKYFLPGAFAAGFFLFGAALIFAGSARLDYASLARMFHDPLLAPGQKGVLLMGFLMVVVAFAFKIGVVPFHFWVPDTYEGAATPVTAYLSAGAKAAGLAALLRLTFLYLPPQATLDSLSLGWDSVSRILAVLAVLTMTLANFTALRQEGLKRMLAYSSVSHSGYALIGLVAGTSEGASAVLVYVSVYALMNFCAFALVIAVEKGIGKTVVMRDLAGLGFARPLFGALLAISMFGLAGLPPTAGFIAKFNIFRSAVNTGHVLLVVAAVFNSLVSVGYYLRVLVPLYMSPAPEIPARPAFSGWLAVTAVACALLILILGVYPNPLLELARFIPPTY